MIKESWMSPLNRIRWIRAFRERKRSCQIRDGRKFTIRYIKWRKRDYALVQPVRGYVPMGIYDLERVTDKIWVTEGEREAEKNKYQNYLESFVNGTEGGVDIREEWPDLAGRKASTLRAGFNAARNRVGIDADGVRVIEDEKSVYLVKGPEDEG